MNTKPSQTFKFKGFKGVLASLAFLDVFCITLAILVLTSEGGGMGVASFCLGCAAVISALGWLYVKGSSDIAIEEGGISRVLFLRKTNFIAWCDVGLVAVVPLRSPDVRRDVRGYTVIPMTSTGKLDRRRKIYFSDRTTDLTDLLRAMNVFIGKYDIRVEIKSDGRVVAAKSL
jgi:hypothetical protein